MSGTPLVDLEDVSGHYFLECFGSKKWTKPSDEEDSESEQILSNKTTGGMALEKHVRNNNQLQMQEGEKDTYKVIKILESSTQKERHVLANKELLEASLVKLPEHYTRDAILEPEESFSDQALKIFNGIPPITMAGILILLGVLAYLGSLRDLLIAGVICTITFYAFNSWLSKAKMETVAKRNQGRDITLQTLDTNKINIIKSLDENVIKGHAMTLQAVENVESTRAHVIKYRIDAVNTIHKRETEKDLRIQNITQSGKNERTRLNAATAREITTIKTNTELQVRNIEAETSRTRIQSEQLMHENQLRNDLSIKGMETRTQEEMKRMEISFQTLNAELRADVDKTRIRANKETRIAKERYKTKRYELEQNAELESIRFSNHLEIARVQERTKQIEAENISKQFL